MAVLHAEGFETFAIGGDRDALGGVYDAAEDSDIDDFAIVEGHADGQALSVTYTGAAWALAIGGITSDATLIRALRLKVASLPAANRELVSYHDAENDELATWVLTPTGSIQLRRGDLAGTLLGESAAGVVPAAEWVFLECKLTLDATEGAYELRATQEGGVVETGLAGAGVNTTATGGTRAWQLWHGSSSEGWLYDDCVLVDASAGLWTTFTGDVELVRSAPVDLAVNQWTPSDAAVPAYELVGDDAEATYVHSSTEDQVESYAFEPVPVDRRVAFAAARPVVRKTDAGTRSIILRVDSLGELAESGALALSTSGVRLCRVWEADPETGGLWAPARLGVAHFGARVPHPQSLSAGPNSASSIVNDPSNFGGFQWSTPSAAGASDDSYAQIDGEFFDEPEFLKFTGFGFAIPESATITGILVELEKRADSTDAADLTLRLTRGGGLVGSNKAGATTLPVWPTSDAYRGYGGEEDLWDTTWTPAQINDPTFGFVFSAWNTSFDTNVMRIDHGRVTIFYSVL